ncbi:MAG: hypothetical protein V7752_18420 [Halopseudomonas sp.]
MKPSPTTAMQLLINQIRQAVPFELDEAQLCRGPCQGCSKKLLEFLDTELCDWEQRLQRGDTPHFGDIQRLAKTGHRIHRVLSNNGIINPN